MGSRRSAPAGFSLAAGRDAEPAGRAPFLETSADVTREANHRKAFDRYSKGGPRDRIEHLFYEAGAHIFRKDMREASYDWLDRWLRGGPENEP
jgi:hypothetical protein